MKNFPTILLIRHGETKWNTEGRYQGVLNSDLTQKGKEQTKANAVKVGKVFNINKPFKIFSSPLGRAKESSYIICDTLGVDKNRIIFDERISEFNYGIFEGKTKDECKRDYPQLFIQREANKWAYQIEDGESYILVANRVKLWLESIKNEKFVVVVAHEMVNRVIRGLYCKLDSDSILLLRQSNNTVIKLENFEESIL